MVDLSRHAGSEGAHLFGAHEEQMLDSMGHARHVIVVGEVPYVDVDRGTGLVCIRVMDKQSFELVRQPDDSIRAVVNRRFLQAISQTLDLRHYGRARLVLR